MKTIDQWFDEYGESHQNPTNKLIHWLCVPSIFFSVVCLLSIPRFSFSIGAETIHFSLATIAIVAVLIFYIRLSLPIALGVALFSIACLFLASRLGALPFPLWASALIIFVVAWIGQFIGHRIEGKKPSFLKDVQFLLIGPAWLISFIYKEIGIKY